jgi:uncharacterized protein YndB with AHSA1/START domain
MKRFAVVAFALFAISTLLLAQPKEFPVKGFTIAQEITLPVTADTLYDCVTGDITDWWDHHMSEKPREISIDARPAGSFYEVFDDAGNGAQHAVVIYADRGKRLRMEGPLGLSGRAVTSVISYDFEAAPGGTKFTVTCNISGQIDEDLAKKVDDVWHHFLYERLKPYIETGKYKSKFGH